jgi:hypothetical protein
VAREARELAGFVEMSVRNYGKAATPIAWAIARGGT